MKTTEREGFDLPSWRFPIARLGCVESGDIEVKPLTLLCGPNNTGKTWVMYALYGFLQSPVPVPPPQLQGLDEVVDKLKQEGAYSWDCGDWLANNSKKIIEISGRNMQRRLPEIFNAEEKIFKDSHFEWDIDPEILVKFWLQQRLSSRFVIGRGTNSVANNFLRLRKSIGETNLQMSLFADLAEKAPRFNPLLLSNIVLRCLLGRPERRTIFLLPAERNGLHLFFKELTGHRTALWHPTNRRKLINIGLLDDEISSNYAEPIAHYIDWLNMLRTRRERKNERFSQFAHKITDLVNGQYEVDTEGNIGFTPSKSKESKSDIPKLDLHLTSSTVKSLFGLWFYLEYQAKPGDVLMIDEPELNLHPSNQRAVARLLARLVNAGIRVVCSTHSDYLVREINSLIMLARPHPQRAALMKRFGYEEEETLKPEQVGAYLFDANRLEAMRVTEDEGIIAKTFDAVIHELNETSDDIYYAYQDDDAGDEA